MDVTLGSNGIKPIDRGEMVVREFTERERERNSYHLIYGMKDIREVLRISVRNIQKEYIELAQVTHAS